MKPSVRIGSMLGLVCAALLLSSVIAFGDWVSLTPIKTNGTVTLTPANDVFKANGNAIVDNSSISSCVGAAAGGTIKPDDTAEAKILNSRLVLRYQWQCGTPVPRTFILSCDRRIHYYLSGDADNYEWGTSRSYAKVWANISISTYPTNVQNGVTDFCVWGDKTKDSTITNALNLSWPPGVTITWGHDNGNEYDSSDDQTRRFADNVPSGTESLVRAEINANNGCYCATYNDASLALVSNQCVDVTDIMLYLP